MKLIIGLGNPGSIYSKNRHNMGFTCVRLLARRYGIRLDKKQSLARTGSGLIEDEPVVLARPQTYMNLSGRSVSRLVKSLKISPEDLVVIHDDLDLPTGRIRIRSGGGSGGHKGIESVIDELGSQDFIRVRIGIGRPFEGAGEDEVIDYVLSDFTPEEDRLMKKAIERACDAIACLITEGLNSAMNGYNRNFANT
ncbi:MAG TPA: aminoacyl-tRNA hydrolase [Dehalococcoidia bacterium]|nr:aminoacyl-tRNA hydrolase [Dehalococcoidia bacterium]